MKTDDCLNAFYALLFALLIGAFIGAYLMREYRDAKHEADFSHYERVVLGGAK